MTGQVLVASTADRRRVDPVAMQVGDNEDVRSRLVASLVLGAMTLPIIFVGLIDPLEGGIALLVAVILGVVVRLLSGVPLPRLAWVAMAATLAVGVGALVLAVVTMPGEQAQVVGPEATAPNPLNATVRVLVWVYRLGVIAVLVGAVGYLVRIGQVLRGGPRQAQQRVDA